MRRLFVAVLLGLLGCLITPVLAQSVLVSVSPTDVVRGESLTVTATGLTPDTSYTFDFSFDNAIIYSTSRRSDSNGRAEVSVRTEASDSLGEYTVEVKDGDTAVGAVTFNVVETAVAPTQIPQSTATIPAPTATPTPVALPDSDVSLEIQPTEGNARDLFNLFISGLPAEELIFVVVTEDNTDLTVYQRDWVADENGEVTVELFTTNENEAGGYTVTVYNEANEVLTEGTFEILEPVGLNGELTITTEGNTSIFEITNLNRFSDVTVEVINTDTDEVVYETTSRTNVDGIVTITFERSADLDAGTYAVVATDEETGVTVAEGEVVVGALVSPDELGLSISPDDATIGRVMTVSMIGLTPNSTVTVRIQVDNADYLVLTQKTNRRGSATVTFKTQDGDPVGDYEIIVLQGGDILLTETIVIDEAIVVVEETPTPEPATPEPTVATSDIELTIDPAEGIQGTAHTITVTGLEAGATVTFNVLLDGANVFTTDKDADADGVAVLILSSSDSDPAGVYIIEAIVDDEFVANAELTITDATATDSTPTPEPTTAVQPSDASITIDPAEGEVGTSHDITVEGLPVGETATFNVIFDGEVVFTTDKEISTGGTAFLALATSEGDSAGVYTIEVVVNDDILARAELIVTDGEPTTDATETPVPSLDDVSVSVDPEEGAIGTSHLITVEGLPAEQDFTLRVVADGDELYSTDRQANADGEFSMRIKADAGDPTGTYTIEIVVNDDVVADTTFEVTAGSAVVEPTATETSNTETETPTPSTDVVIIENVTGESEVIEDELTEDEPTFTYDVDLEQGDVLSVAVNSDDFDSVLQILDVDGYEVGYNDDLSSDNYNSAINVFVAPYDGTFTMSVTSYDNYNGYTDVLTGAFTLTVTEVSIAEITYNQATQITLSADSPNQLLSFEGTAGEVISVVAQGNGVDSLLALNDPSGYEVVVDDDGGSGYDPEIVRYVILTDGLYILRVGSYDVTTSGTVIVTINTNGVNTLDDGGKTITLNAKANSDVVTFEGEAGETVLLTITFNEGSAGDISVFADQDGGALMNYASNAGVPAELTLPIIVATDGTVRVTISTSSGNGSFDVEIER